MSNARFFDVKMYFAEKVTAVLMSMLFADFARKTHFFSREEHAVRGIPRTADTVENGMSHTVASRELVYQVPSESAALLIHSLGAPPLIPQL